MKTRSSRIFQILLFLLVLYSCKTNKEEPLTTPEKNISKVWVPDLGNEKYKNPIIHADYSDPDVVRVGTDYYMTASSFNCVPGLPILHSKDLVNWKIINHALKKQIPEEVFNNPQHGNGAWAPSIRYHRNYYYIFYGDPDYGIYMIRTENPYGEWSAPHLVKAAKGWIDPCPLWDDDGKAYLVHAYAGSRAGIKSVLIVHEMSVDGKRLLDDGVMVFDGHQNNPTVEGPKFYRQNGYYYIFAPAGGVTSGWQLVLRSKNVLGPYQVKKVMHQGNTEINGPHQGGWVKTNTGEDWFIHFQDKEAYGRIVHLQPMAWQDGWPIIGTDQNKDGIGEPVTEYTKPDVGSLYPVSTPQCSDEFNEPTLGKQWQWHANTNTRYGYPSGRLGYFRLNAVPKAKGISNLWDVPNLLLQKFSAESFAVTTKVEFHPQLTGDKVGLLIMGKDYTYLAIKRVNNKLQLEQVVCYSSEKGNAEEVLVAEQTDNNLVYLRAKVSENAKLQFYYSFDNVEYKSIGEKFTAKPGKWIGAKIGLFCLADSTTNDSGYANVDWFRVH